MDEMDVESIDLGDELRQGVEPDLTLAPVVLRRPISRESLSGRELHPLRLIRDRLAIRPSSRGDAPAQFGEVRLGHTQLKRTNGGLVTARVLRDDTHDLTPFQETEKAPWVAGHGCRHRAQKAHRLSLHQ